MANVFEPEFDELRDHPGFRALRARVGQQAGAARLGASVSEIPAGEPAYPYHLHLGEEEMVVVFSCRPSLRTPEVWHELEEGEVVAFQRGEAGAHQIANRTEDTVRFLALSTNGEPDIVLYPDSGKVGAAERLPKGGGFRKSFRLEDKTDYYQGEPPPSS